MINFEINASSSLGKKVEFEQSIDSIQKKLLTISSFFEVINHQNGSYKFIFNFKTKEEAQKLFKSESFVLIAGAIKTLCNEAYISLNGKQIQLKEINLGSVSDNHEYKILISNL